ncbi:MAG: YIP1 family protein [Ignavibacteriales bacterium]|nr:YIP1 family protein [Ignavibacteriales bacterium]
MLVCPTCAFENDDFSTVCANCKSFLQNRVPNLNLFETAWGVIEAPRTTFRTIVLAEHKNYSFFLFVCFGIALSFTAFWYFKLGELFDTLLDLIPWAFGTGVAVGLVSAVLFSALYHGTARLLGSSMRFRNSFALLAYSLVPIALSLVLVLPIELLTFGMYLFTANPHPWVIKPVSYAMLLGFDTVIAFWSIALAVLGTSVVHRFSFSKSIVTVMILLSSLAALFLGGSPHLVQLLRTAGE